jgi:hypothetical protein
MVHATSTHSPYVLKLTYCFLLQEWLHERNSVVRYTYISCLVLYVLPTFNFAHFDPILVQWLILIMFYRIFVLLCLVLFKRMPVFGLIFTVAWTIERKKLLKVHYYYW